MTKPSLLFLGAIVSLAISFLPARAKCEDYYVGACARGKANFTTISKAAAAVPPGSVIKICPGVYPEQVTIEKPLTLHGVTDENGGTVVVTVPAAGLKLNIDPLIPYGCEDSCELHGVAQISAVNVDGIVNISDIVIDGAGAVLPLDGFSASPLTGMNFDSTSVNVEHVEIRNEYYAADHSGSPTGYGIIIGDTQNKRSVVSIVQSHLYLFSNTGIESSGTLLAAENAIDLRTISGAIGVYGMFQVGGSATIINNQITGNGTPGLSPGTGVFLGIGVDSPQAESSIDRNTVSNTILGIYAHQQPGQKSKRISISGNRLIDNQTAIAAGSAYNSIIESNSITGFGGQSGASTGISFGCGGPLPTLDNNVFSGTTIALSGVPAGTAQATGSRYHNVQQLNQACP